MSTEIDLNLKDQNKLLLEQNKLLKEKNLILTNTITLLKKDLNNNKNIEQYLDKKIEDKIIKLQEIRDLDKLQEFFQEKFTSQLELQLTKALRQSSLNRRVDYFIEEAFIQVQHHLTKQQKDIEQALLKISQWKLPENLEKNLDAQREQVHNLIESLKKMN